MRTVLADFLSVHAALRDKILDEEDTAGPTTKTPKNNKTPAAKKEKTWKDRGEIVPWPIGSTRALVLQGSRDSLNLESQTLTLGLKHKSNSPTI